MVTGQFETFAPHPQDVILFSTFLVLFASIYLNMLLTKVLIAFQAKIDQLKADLATAIAALPANPAQVLSDAEFASLQSAAVSLGLDPNTGDVPVTPV